MELTYSFKVDKSKIETYCRGFGYSGSSTEELMEFYDRLLLGLIFSWNGFFSVKDSEDNPIYSYTFNEDE